MFVTRNVWMKYRNPADGEGGDLGGGDGAAKGAGEGEGKGAGEGEGKGAGEGKGGEGEGKAGEKKPSDEEARLLKENMKRKGQIEDLTKKLDAVNPVLKALEDLGGLDAIKSLVAEKKSAEEKQLEARGDYERLKQRMGEEHAKEKKVLADRISELEGDLGKSKGTINELSIGSQFGQSKFISEELTLTPTKARVIYADHFDLEDGKIVGYDKPRGAANRTALVDGNGDAVGFDAALRKIVEADPEKDHLMKSKVKPGASSDSKKPAGAAAKESAPASSVDRIAAGLKGLKIS